MKKIIIVVIGAYSAWVTFSGLASANQMIKISSHSNAAIKAALDQ